jgi:DNA-binding MarR family transcriptional regulator
MIDDRLYAKDLDESIIAYHIVGGGLLIRMFEKIMSQYDLSTGEYAVLRHLTNQKSEMNLRAVKEATFLLSGASITKVTEKLYKKGFITRRENPLSRREKLIKITPTGEKMADSMLKETRKLNGTILAGLNQSAKEKALKALRQISQNVHDMDKK